MYIKKKDIEMLENVRAYLSKNENFEMAYDLDTFITHALFENQKQSLKAAESMRKYRDNNPEKAKTYQRNYMRAYNRRKKERSK